MNESTAPMFISIDPREFCPECRKECIRGTDRYPGVRHIEVTYSLHPFSGVGWIETRLRDQFNHVNPIQNQLYFDGSRWMIKLKPRDLPVPTRDDEREFLIKTQMAMGVQTTGGYITSLRAAFEASRQIDALGWSEAVRRNT